MWVREGGEGELFECVHGYFLHKIWNGMISLQFLTGLDYLNIWKLFSIEISVICIDGGNFISGGNVD